MSDCIHRSAYLHLALNQTYGRALTSRTFLAAPTPPTSLVSLIILAIMEDAPMAFYDLDIVEDIAKKVSASVGSDSSGTARPAREARELMRKGERYEGDAGVQALLR